MTLFLLNQGSWVLLENINNTPQDVFERLNPLLERRKTFEVDSETIQIPESFQLFMTACDKAPHSFELSTALRDRVLSIWLPSLLTLPNEEILSMISNLDVASRFSDSELQRHASAALHQVRI
jgi:midasin (ATPase involved in ribosome maturation)